MTPIAQATVCLRSTAPTANRIVASLPLLADLVLATAQGEDAAGVLIEPARDGYAVVLETGAVSTLCAEIPLPLGRALAARLALMADLDLGVLDEQVGRLRVSNDGLDVEWLALLRVAPTGLAIELRRLDAMSTMRAHGAAPRDARLPDGTLLRIADQYRVLEAIGSGAMGEVYRAYHEPLDREVAIKVIHEHLARDPTIAAMFVREARAASRTRHPGIVEVFDFGRLDDGRSYLVMELVAAPTLEHELIAGALEPRVAVQQAIAAAEALACVHAHGVVHRDLKPANLFVLAPDRNKLGDFGAAKLVHDTLSPSQTQQGMIVGTPDYMSPEHCLGRSTDGRTDLYALGCVLFEMLSGHRPFPGDSPLDVQMQQVQAPVPRVRSPLRLLPDVLVTTVARAMAKSLTARYQTAAEMKADLERAARALSR